VTRGRSRVGRSGRSRVGRSGARAQPSYAWLAGRPSTRARGGSPGAVRGRELASPFLTKPIQMSFAGIGRSTPEPAGTREPLRPGRWVYEKGAARAARAAAWPRRWPLPPGERTGCIQVSSSASRRAVSWPRAREPIFSETHTNEFCGIGKSTPEPAGPCAPLRPGRWVYERARNSCGGDVEYVRASAPLRGSLRGLLLVPFHTSPPSRGALRSAGVLTIAANTTSAPLLPLRSGPVVRAASGKTLQA
jgi:hypothetical protein